jgi:GNAT superfamily N-acetyltransferase
MFRPTVPTDTPALLKLTEDTGFFSTRDIDILREVLDDYPAEAEAEGHHCITAERSGRPIGFAYFAPIAMSDRTWYLWWIVVCKDTQKSGLGTRLLKHVEETVRAAHGRILFLETSSLPLYEPTRRFYVKTGYEIAAVLKDYYADGHDMVVFRKRLTD